MGYEQENTVDKTKEVDEQMYWKTLKFARKAIYEEQAEQILTVIEQPQDKSKAVGQVVSDLGGTLIRDGVTKGAKFNRPTVRKLFQSLISDIAEFANAKGMIAFESQEQVDRFVNECLLHATEQYAKQVKRRRIAGQQKGVKAQQPQQPQQPPQGLLQQ